MGPAGQYGVCRLEQSSGDASGVLEVDVQVLRADGADRFEGHLRDLAHVSQEGIGGAD